MDEPERGSRIGPYPYRIVHKLSRGGGSEIYLARIGDEPVGDEPHQLVVLKVTRVDTEHRELFYDNLSNEVERLRRLKHPRIVRVFPIQKAGGLKNLPYIAQAELPGNPWFSVMEFLGGGSLATWIREQGPLAVGRALEVVRELAAALDYMHHRGQVHLDIKPENILFRRPPGEERLFDPVLIDFGVARDIGQKEFRGLTWRWTAPELIDAAQNPNRPPETIPPPNTSMDVYALGLVLYQLLTGEFPFKGRTRSGLTTSILTSEPTAPSEHVEQITKALDELVLRAISKNPERRPSALEFALRLEEIAARRGDLVALAPLATPNEPVELPPPGRNWRRALTFERLLILLLVIAVVAQMIFILAGQTLPPLGSPAA